MQSTMQEIAEDLYTRVSISDEIKKVIEDQDLSNNEKDKQIRIIIVNANISALNKFRRVLSGEEAYSRDTN